MECPGPRLSLHDIGVWNLELIDAEYYGLTWNREGEKRGIPRHVFENVYREFNNDLKRGVLKAETLSKMFFFKWEQAVSPGASSS